MNAEDSYDERLQRKLIELCDDQLIAWRALRLIAGSLEHDGLVQLVGELEVYAASAEYRMDKTEVETIAAQIRLERQVERLLGAYELPENLPGGSAPGFQEGDIPGSSDN
jgi:hypothetical protein